MTSISSFLFNKRFSQYALEVFNIKPISLLRSVSVEPYLKTLLISKNKKRRGLLVVDSDKPLNSVGRDSLLSAFCYVDTQTSKK